MHFLSKILVKIRRPYDRGGENRWYGWAFNKTDLIQTCCAHSISKSGFQATSHRWPSGSAKYPE